MSYSLSSIAQSAVGGSGDNNINITLNGLYNDRGLNRGLETIRKEMEKTQKSTNTASAQMAKTMNSSSASMAKNAVMLGAKLIGVGSALAVMTAGVAYAIKNIREQEDAEMRLSSAMKLHKQYTDEAFASNIAFASSMQKITTYGDDVIINAQALLMSYGMTQKAMQSTIKTAMDFASATGKDLNSALTLLAKAYKGHTAELGRYGIIIDENIPKSQKFTAVLAELNKMFGGRAEAEKNTLTGSLKSFSNALGDLSEEIVKTFVPTGRSMMNTLTSLLEGLSEKIKEVRGLYLAQTGQTKIESIKPVFQNDTQKSAYTLATMGIQATPENMANYYNLMNPLINFTSATEGNLKTGTKTALLSAEILETAKTDFTTALTSAIVEASKDGTAIGELTTVLKTSLKDSTRTAIVQGFIQAVVVDKAIKPLTDALKSIQIDAENGKVFGLNKIQTAMETVGKSLKVIDPLFSGLVTTTDKWLNSIFKVGNEGGKSLEKVKTKITDITSAVKNTNSELSTTVSKLDEASKKKDRIYFSHSANRENILNTSQSNVDSLGSSTTEQIQALTSALNKISEKTQAWNALSFEQRGYAQTLISLKKSYFDKGNPYGVYLGTGSNSGLNATQMAQAIMNEIQKRGIDYFAIKNYMENYT